MDFAHVIQAPGKYIDLQVVVTDIQHRTGDWGNWATGKAMDGPGISKDVSFAVAGNDQQGNPKVFPTDLAINHRINCAGKFDANTNKMRIYFNSYSQEQAPPPNSYPPVQQPAPQQQPYQQPAPQQPRPTPPPTRDATGVSIERQAAWKSACEVAARRSPMSLDDTEAWALRGSQFMTDGRLHPQGPPTHPAGVNPNYDPDRPPPVDDDSIPF